MKILAVSFSVLLAVTASIGAQTHASYTKISPFRGESSMFLSAATPKTESACTSFADSLSILAIGCNAVSVTPVNLNTGVFVTPPGTQNSVGSVYRYSSVATTPGGTVLDAIVTILSSTNTQDTTPNTIGAADVPGATAGFDQNLQPNLNQGGTFPNNAPWNGSITYRIQFVQTGTSTPRVITVAATSIDNDGSGACGGLAERVTYGPGYNQILINSPTTQTLAGATVSGPNGTVQAGIGLSPQYASTALYVNVSQIEWTYGFTTLGNCAVGGAPEVRYGSLNLACQIDFTPVFVTVALSGTVFNDLDGLTDSNVDGTGTNAGGLFANLLDGNNNVVTSVPVAANGTYSFPNAVAGTYTIQISTVAGIESNPGPAQTLPAGWVSTGENLGAGAGNDGTVNALLPVTVGAAAITNANFGIEQRPTANSNSAASQVNPGGTTQLTVPPATFSATDPSGGTVTAIRITAYPSGGALRISINGIQYTPGTFPVGGVTVPTNAAGNPTQPITFDPIDGGRTIVFPYVAIDNAGVESTASATASIPVTAGTTAAEVSISGRVLDDQGRGAARSRITVVGSDGIVRSGLTNPFGYFRVSGLEVNELYQVSVTNKRFVYESRTLTLTEDFSGLDFIPVP